MIAPAAAVAAAGSAPLPVVGAQDSWVNSCDKGSTPDYSPKGADPAVPAVDSPYWQALDMNTVRFSPQWDIAYHSPGSHLQVVQDCFDYWLAQLASRHVAPEIAFKPDYGYTRHGHVLIPALSRYAAAMKAFFARYGHQVKIVAPWGEPEFRPGNGPAYDLRNGSAFDATKCPKKVSDANCGPALAAQMWVAVRHLCPSCTVIAGDFGSNQGKDFKYLAIYKRFLRDVHGGHHVYHPSVWGIHPYTDVLTWEHEIKHHAPLTKPQETLVARFAARLAVLGYHRGTRIWLDEVSSFTVSPSIFKGERYSRTTQAAGARQLLTRLVKAGGASVPREPVVTRIYYMRFAGDTPDALIVKGHREPVYHVFATRQKAAANAASTRATQVTAVSRDSSGRVHASGVILDPICHAFFMGNPPNLVLVHGKLTVSGSSEYPDCAGSATNKALTTRQGQVCLQVHEGTTRRGTWRNVKCSTRTFPTRAFGTYTLTAGKVCPARRHLHQYRMWQWLYLQRGTLTNKAAGIGLRKFIKC
jgi:hypothetical protein